MPARRNPRTKLTKIAFHAQDGLSQREMARSRRRFTFERAAKTFSDWSGRSTEAVRSEGLRVIAEEVLAVFDDAREALKTLTKLNRRLGVWCACAVARELLKYVKKGDNRPRRAVETTEDWVRGIATKEQVRKAAEAAESAANDAYASYAAAAYAAVSVAHAVDAALPASDTAFVAYAATNAVAYDGHVAEDELRRLVEVVAEAVMTFPVRSRSNPTRRRKD